jgi:sister-chromatid-cohesion protein PDS5
MIIATPPGKMPDPSKATTDLKAFASENIAQLYRELKVLLDPQTDLKTYIKNEVRLCPLL